MPYALGGNKKFVWNLLQRLAPWKVPGCPYRSRHMYAVFHRCLFAGFFADLCGYAGYSVRNVVVIRVQVCPQKFRKLQRNTIPNATQPIHRQQGRIQVNSQSTQILQSHRLIQPALQVVLSHAPPPCPKWSVSQTTHQTCLDGLEKYNRICNPLNTVSIGDTLDLSANSSPKLRELTGSDSDEMPSPSSLATRLWERDNCSSAATCSIWIFMKAGAAVEHQVKLNSPGSYSFLYDSGFRALTGFPTKMCIDIPFSDPIIVRCNSITNSQCTDLYQILGNCPLHEDIGSKALKRPFNGIDVDDTDEIEVGPLKRRRSDGEWIEVTELLEEVESGANGSKLTEIA